MSEYEKLATTKRKYLNNLSNEEQIKILSSLSEIANNHLVENGYTGKEFSVEKFKKTNKYYLIMGLNDDIYNAEADKFATVDFTLKTKFRLYLKSNILNYMNDNPLRIKDNYERIDFYNLDEMMGMAKESIFAELELYESTLIFGCCSRYEQCSNEGKCIHDYKLYAKGCQYRKNLEKGMIFYGKNKAQQSYR